MNFERIIKYLSVLLAILFFLGWENVGMAQKYSNEFLSIGVGAAAQGKGNAVFATAGDVTSAYWNPAGLLKIGEDVGLQLGAMHSEWFAGVGNYDYLGVSIPTTSNRSRLALSLIRFGIDDIPNTLSLFEADGTINYDNVVSFSAADYAFLLSYARGLKTTKGKLNVGGNVKIIRRVIGTFANSWGFGLDFGAQYEIGKMSFGLMLRDITTTFNAWQINYTQEEKDILLSTGNALPKIQSNELTKPSIAMGASYTIQFNSFSLIPEVAILITTDGKRNTLISGEILSADPSFGIELNYKDGVFLRAGIDQFQEALDIEGVTQWQTRPSLGIGLKLKKFNIDYAYTDLGDSRNTYAHVISLLLSLNRRN